MNRIDGEEDVRTLAVRRTEITFSEKKVRFLNEMDPISFIDNWYWNRITAVEMKSDYKYLRSGTIS